MIANNIKKLLSGTIAFTYLLFYTAPFGMCAEAVSKPALRGQAKASVTAPAASNTAYKPSVLKLEGDIALTKGNPKITLSLRNSDVKQVLRMFADKAGLNIIFHESAAGSVTMDLVNMPLNDAFKLILQVTSLTYYIDNNTMVVASATAAQGLNLSKQEMMTIPVKYVEASTLANFLNANIFSMNKPGLSNAQIAVTNPGRNEILIFGTKNDFLMAKKVVEQFDQKPLEQTFVVNHTTPKEMAELVCGVLYPQPSSASGGSSSGSSSQPASSSSGGGTPTGGAIALGTGITACQYDNQVSAGSLASVGTRSMAVTYFPQRGMITVMGGSLQQMELIKEFILKNDKKQPQAYLEISIIELNESGSRDFSNTWRAYNSFFSGGFDGTTTTNPYRPTFIQGDEYVTVPGEKTLVQNSVTGLWEIITSPETILNKYTGMPTLTYAINYLIKNGKGRTLANPRIMITNGEISKIDLSSDYVKSVTSQVLSTMAGATQRTYEIGSDEGIKVDIEPFISPDGYVTLNIKPEYSTVKEKVTSANAATGTTDLVATLLQRRNLDLKNVRIRDGETVVIGGMIRETEEKTISKMPFLGDLPGVGMFFRNTNTTKGKQELVIMLTPKIVKDTEDIVNKSGTNL